jgi:hypothetical protein
MENDSSDDFDKLKRMLKEYETGKAPKLAEEIYNALNEIKECDEDKKGPWYAKRVKLDGDFYKLEWAILGKGESSGIIKGFKKLSQSEFESWKKVEVDCLQKDAIQFIGPVT